MCGQWLRNLLETSFGCRCVPNDCETYVKLLSVADVRPMILKPTWNVFRLQMCGQWFWNLLETSFGCRCVANDCETYLKRLSVADVRPMIVKPTWNVFRLQMCAQWLRNLLETSFGCRCVANDWQFITDCKNYQCYWAKVTGGVIFTWSDVLCSLPFTSAWELERKEIGGLEKSFEVGKKVMWPLVIYQCSQVCMYICEMFNLEWSLTICFTYSVVVLCAME